MKRHLNTSYRLVWNHITGTLVVASELARSRGKGAGVAVALSLAAVTSVPALAADSIVQAGETVNGGTLENHDNQIVLGTANGMTISTGLELGPDSEENTGGQWIQNGGIAGNTTVTTNGRQVVLEGGTASDTVIRDGGGQSLNGLAVNTTLNNRGEQWVHEGGVATGTIINRDGYQSIKSGGLATGTIINTGAEGGPDSDNSYTGQKVQGTAESTTINKNGRQIILFSGIARDTLIYAGGDQSVHGRALNTTLNGGYQYVHKDGLALNTVINEGGWQVVKAGGAVGNTTINQNGELRVHAGGEATAVTQNTGGALVTSTAATVTGINRLGAFSVVEGKADNVVLENGGRLDVLTGHTATNTRVDDGGTLDVRNGGTATTVSMGNGGVLLADSGAAVSGTRSDGKAFSIGGGQADALMLEKGSSFTLNAGDTATDTTVNGGLFTARGGTLAGTTTLNNGAILTLSGKTVNNDTLTIREGDALLQGGSLTGNGSVEKSGSGTLTVSNTTLTQKAVNLNEGTLTLNDSTVTTDVIAQRGTALKLTGSTVLNGAIDPTNVTLASGATWNIPDNGETIMQNITLIGIDLGKHSFHIHCQDKSGKALLRKKFTRTKLMQFLATCPPSVVVMEACAGAHFMARCISDFGHETKLISPQFVRPFVKSNKNDFVDAEAICEAASRPSMRFVQPRTETQQAMRALHRVRESLIRDKVKTTNQIHGFLLEFGISLPIGDAVIKRLSLVLAEHEIPEYLSRLLVRLHTHYFYLVEQIAELESELSQSINADDTAQRIMTIPGVGPITASLLSSQLGDGKQFSCSRDFAASTGLVPRQYSTGGKSTLLGISKRGDKNLRRLLVQCARSFIMRLERKHGKLAEWVREQLNKKHSNVVTCALANKLARIAWAITTQKKEYQA